MEIRTERERLIGMLDERTNTFIIKDRRKETRIEVPPCGLRISFTSGDGRLEEVYIPPTKENFYIT